MKKIISIFVILSLAFIMLVGCTGTSTSGEATLQETSVEAGAVEQDGLVDDYGAAGATTYGDDLTVEAMMTYALQDEYLAYATYEQILSEYGEVTPFSNIIRAEAYHIELLTALFDAYGYMLPEDTSASHVPSPRSFEEALAAGVVAEEDNIAMYEAFLDSDLPDDVRAAFEDLKAASEMHLEAFSRNGGGRGNGNGNGGGRNYNN